MNYAPRQVARTSVFTVGGNLGCRTIHLSGTGSNGGVPVKSEILWGINTFMAELNKLLAEK